MSNRRIDRSTHHLEDVGWVGSKVFQLALALLFHGCRAARAVLLAGGGSSCRATFGASLAAHVTTTLLN
eukprot:CAMPEP_0195017838 /NCGR_PEP_ID=MMETSP0326_2-20130528/28727_1 /TAXON_ID=2866 ORGANISM="Crypthecodinium cohnii, Strain Seligo" /NCGR_SAMPLE_ID=MMETSP0326_2 /ASSEMBLY_ACC=CAM_ASM_000348 /LENGTH=68 /DNA_ID=CAMNT_0040034839 /DNA_START=21 /DNA_END=224 /DNA_ORIENTATION=-